MMTQESDPSIGKLLGLIGNYSGLKETDPLKRKLEYILKGLSGPQMDQWIQSIQLDPHKTELSALVEDLNNHETYFFRDQAQMRAIETKLLPNLIQEKINKKDHTIRIWSAACSSGEETYTLAMQLLQTFINFKLSVELKEGFILPPHGWKIEVLGTDISRQVIRKAKEGIYEASDNGLSSFRNFPESYMRFFNLKKEYQDSLGNNKRVYQVNDVVKSFVRFDLFNLMNPHPPSNDFDLVLCRNLMIYLHEDAQRRVQTMLKRALRPKGIFMLSAVDKLLETASVEAHRDMSCVYYEKTF
ncbi:MAG TPA: CheR family methyltransferase [Pseudomonadales bacterium]